VLRGNNIYGNGDGAAGCGVINAGGIVDAINNYLGEGPTGPVPIRATALWTVSRKRQHSDEGPLPTTPFPLEPHSQ
jgi:hypothetical protein